MILNVRHTVSNVGSVGALFLLNIFVTVERARFPFLPDDSLSIFALPSGLLCVPVHPYHHLSLCIYCSVSPYENWKSRLAMTGIPYLNLPARI